MNPMQLFQMLQNNPNMMMGNPVFQRAMQMGQGKSEDELKAIIKNVAKEKGMSLDQLNALISPLGLRL